MDAITEQRGEAKFSSLGRAVTGGRGTRGADALRNADQQSRAREVARLSDRPRLKPAASSKARPSVVHVYEPCFLHMGPPSVLHRKEPDVGWPGALNAFLEVIGEVIGANIMNPPPTPPQPPPPPPMPPPAAPPLPPSTTPTSATPPPPAFVLTQDLERLGSSPAPVAATVHGGRGQRVQLHLLVQAPGSTRVQLHVALVQGGGGGATLVLPTSGLVECAGGEAFPIAIQSYLPGEMTLTVRWNSTLVASTMVEYDDALPLCPFHPSVLKFYREHVTPVEWPNYVRLQLDEARGGIEARAKAAQLMGGRPWSSKEGLLFQTAGIFPAAVIGRTCVACSGRVVPKRCLYCRCKACCTVVLGGRCCSAHAADPQSSATSAAAPFAAPPSAAPARAAPSDKAAAAKAKAPGRAEAPSSAGTKRPAQPRRAVRGGQPAVALDPEASQDYKALLVAGHDASLDGKRNGLVGRDVWLKEGVGNSTVMGMVVNYAAEGVVMRVRFSTDQSVRWIRLLSCVDCRFGPQPEKRARLV